MRFLAIALAQFVILWCVIEAKGGSWEALFNDDRGGARRENRFFSAEHEGPAQGGRKTIRSAFWSDDENYSQSSFATSESLTNFLPTKNQRHKRRLRRESSHRDNPIRQLFRSSSNSKKSTKKKRAPGAFAKMDNNLKPKIIKFASAEPQADSIQSDGVKANLKNYGTLSLGGPFGIISTISSIITIGLLFVI